jgi:hypothetical protein
MPRRDRPGDRPPFWPPFGTRLAAMKKLLLLAILVGLAAFAAKKVRAA